MKNYKNPIRALQIILIIYFSAWFIFTILYSEILKINLLAAAYLSLIAFFGNFPLKIMTNNLYLLVIFQTIFGVTLLILLISKLITYRYEYMIREMYESHVIGGFKKFIEGLRQCNNDLEKGVKINGRDNFNKKNSRENPLYSLQACYMGAYKFIKLKSKTDPLILSEIPNAIYSGILITLLKSANLMIISNEIIIEENIRKNYNLKRIKYIKRHIILTIQRLKPFIKSEKNLILLRRIRESLIK